MKKFLVLLIMLMAAVMLTSAAEDEPTVYISGDFKYVLLEDGTAEITDYLDYKRAVTELTIPATLDGHSVTSIGYQAFYGCSKLTSVTIPNSVTSIGDSAFSICSKLTSITIPDSVTSIGKNPFSNCDKLTSIIVSIDHPTFATIDGVLFEKSTKTLICYPCASKAKRYAIPQGIKIIGASAFSYCNNLTSVTIPSSVTSIGDKAFYNCSNLTSITIPDSVTSIGEYAFQGCSSLISITIPNSVTSIGDSAFSFCSKLTSITIPDSVTSIGRNPFRHCDKLTSIIVSVDHPTLATIDGVLFEKSTKTLVCYPRAFTAKIYAIPQDIKIIGDEAFYSCSSLTSITIPDSVTSIGDDAFIFCDSLTTITIPDSVTSIGDDAFYWCDALTSITVGRDSYARQYCIDNGLPYTYPDANDWLLD
ncbi:MAG: leucine-rich repeat domain-containing protein [Clostridia bacterium]|nr:leucine-rich repeat domain-containing protein [Clostridia bacterium]